MTPIEKEIKIEKRSLDYLVKILDKLYPKAREGAGVSFTDVTPPHEEGIFRHYFHYTYFLHGKNVAEMYAQLESGELYELSLLLDMPDEIYNVLQKNLQKKSPEVWKVLMEHPKINSNSY